MSVNGKTNYLLIDTNFVAQFDSDFTFPVTIFEKENGIIQGKIVRVQIGIMNSKKHKEEIIGSIKMDIANLPDPRDTSLKIASIQLEGRYGSAKLAFRVNVIPQDEYPDGPPVCYYTFICTRSVKPAMLEVAQTESQFTEFDEVQETSSEEIFKFEEIEKPEYSLDKFTKVLPPKPVSKEHIPKPKKSKPFSGKKPDMNAFLHETGRRKERNLKKTSLKTGSGKIIDEDAIAKNHREMIKLVAQHTLYVRQLNLQQCAVSFSEAAYKAIAVPSKRQKDLSKDLIKPITDFHVLEIPDITEQELENMVEPMFDCLDFALRRQSEPTELFGLLATILNFGIELSSAASIYTSSHGKVLARISTYVNNILHLLAHTLMAVLAASVSGDGFDCGGPEALAMVGQQTRIFRQLAVSFSIPEIIVQEIVVACCAYYDALLFNVIIDTAESFPEDKLDSLLSFVRDIQRSFNCISENFTLAFQNLLGFISTAKEVQALDIRHLPSPSPLLRSIADRTPGLILPNGFEIEKLGPRVDTFECRVPLPQQSFSFSFEWLFTNTAEGRFDF